MASVSTGDGDLPRLIGMIHLLPLPGSPDFSGDFDAVLEQAAADAATLVTAGYRRADVGELR